MDEDTKDRAELVASAVIEAAALAIPPASLLSTLLIKIGQDRQRRRVETLQALSDELERVRDRIDHDFVESPGFAGLVEEVVEKANQRREVDKRDYYAALLGSAALPERPDPSDVDRMIDTLGRLRPSHLWLFAIVAGEHSWSTPADSPMSSFQQEFEIAHPGIKLDALRLDWNDLVSAGLLSPMPSGIMTQAGARNIRGQLTELGRKFHQFVVLPYSDVHPHSSDPRPSPS